LGALTMWDVQVGRLMSMLKEKGVADKTAIFYTADNGAHQVRQPKKNTTATVSFSGDSLVEG
jgi:arylsulfatase A-like enzyme